MDFKDELIKRGYIFHSYKFENIEHGKFFVVIGEDKNNYVGYFFINSNRNPYISGKPKLFDMQIPIKKSVYSSFLTHDSYISCHEISKISKNKLREQINMGITQYKEHLIKEDVKILLESLKNSDLYSEEEKEQFFS